MYAVEATILLVIAKRTGSESLKLTLLNGHTVYALC